MSVLLRKLSSSWQAGKLTSSWGPLAAVTCAAQSATTCSTGFEQTGKRRAWGYTFVTLTAALTAAGVATTASCEESFSFATTQRRMFFKYEKKLREFSTHEKIFDYFSSRCVDGRKCMSASDVLRALLAVYPPDSASWDRSGSLAGETKPVVEHRLSEEAIDFLNDFDIDGDGSFSFSEFILFLVLLSMPLKDMQAIFTLMDVDESSTLDKQEFMDVVNGLMQFAGKAAPSKISRSGPYRSTATSGDDDDEPFINKWFGSDGKGLLKLADFAAFLVKLHSTFDGMEFDLLDVDGDGAISGLDLARSLVSPASTSLIDRLLDRANDLPAALREARIDRPTFLAVQSLVRKFHRVTVPLFFWQDTGHTPNVQDTQRLVKFACRVHIPDEAMKIFIHVFTDDTGNWVSSALHSAMNSKYQHVNFDSGDAQRSFVGCMLRCVNPVQP